MKELTNTDKIKHYLDKHSNQWISARQLADVINVSDHRQVRTVIAELRDNGLTIASGNNGYMLTTNAQTLLDSANRLRATALKTLKQAQALKRAAMEVQLEKLL